LGVFGSSHEQLSGVFAIITQLNLSHVQNGAIK
jgi:hypothetical protein